MALILVIILETANSLYRTEFYLQKSSFTKRKYKAIFRKIKLFQLVWR